MLYGIIAIGTNDHNGAFYQDAKRYQGLDDQLDGASYGIRVIEIDSVTDFARRLIQLDRRYGKNHKIAFAIVGGHGTKDSIHLGAGRKTSTLEQEHLQGKGVRRTKKFFEEGAIFILESCSSGQEEGIAQEWSRALGVKVSGPNVPGHIKEINARLQDGRVHLEASYYSTDHSSYSKGNRSD